MLLIVLLEKMCTTTWFSVYRIPALLSSGAPARQGIPARDLTVHLDSADKVKHRA